MSESFIAVGSTSGMVSCVAMFLDVVRAQPAKCVLSAVFPFGFFFLAPQHTLAGQWL